LSSIEKPVPSRIELVYSNVKLNAKIRVEEFAFTAPPTATVDDGTEMIVRGLDQAIQMQAEQKKAEAAKKDGAVLEQSINLPSPTDNPPPRQN
jgi:hypothetical protein